MIIKFIVKVFKILFLHNYDNLKLQKITKINILNVFYKIVFF